MNTLPILSIDDFFLFPKCSNYLSINDANHLIELLSIAWNNYQGKLIVVSWEEKTFNINTPQSFSPVGTLAEINLGIPLEVDFKTIVNFLKDLKEIKLQGLERVKVTDWEREDKILNGEYQVLSEAELDENILEELAEKLARNLPNILKKVKLSSIEKVPFMTMTMMKGDISNVIDFIAQKSQDVDKLNKQKILTSLDVRERLEILINLPNKQKIEKTIEDETREEIRNQQEEYYLREKLKTIEKKLREKKSRTSSGIGEYLDRLEKEPYPNYVKTVIYKEIERHGDLFTSNSTEASIVKQYIEWLINLPWWQKTTESKDLVLVRQKLDEKHYGLEEVKEEISRYLAASWKAKEPLGQIMLLCGPPGVGKTSIASSIAEALGRKFASISVAGLDDVAEIKGHRRTYSGAMPGQIIQVMKKVQVQNPLIFIDEVDKIGQHSFRGNPSYALLEVFDPQQNKKFIDYYLGQEVPYDLSNVIFICAANELREIPFPLLNRMKVIYLSSYTPVEKFNIAKNYLIPTILKRYHWTTVDKKENQKGIEEEKIQFSDEAIREIINHYTRESGVRGLSGKIEQIIQKFIVELTENKKEKITITPENLKKEYLKKKGYFEFTTKQKHPRAGSATGLAWTGYGGDILPIEVVYYPRKESDPELTGNLGDIMKESCRVALNYLRAATSQSKKFNIDPKVFSQNVIHIHAPEGSTPKEGPSAGVALTSAIISALTGKVIPSDIGMTGEITLHGHVGEIGGLKEKAIAAHRSELKTIIIPKNNEKDIEDIPAEIRQELKIITVEDYEEVWKIIFKKQTNSIKNLQKSVYHRDAKRKRRNEKKVDT